MHRPQLELVLQLLQALYPVGVDNTHREVEPVYILEGTVGILGAGGIQQVRVVEDMLLEGRLLVDMFHEDRSPGVGVPRNS